ncbi:hypothetical protein ABPG75_013786 [Micractinium tetrahymenae]
MSNKQVMAAHLARKVQHTVSRREVLPQDLLVSGVSTAFAGATGFPEAADSVAYEPTQGLLAVGTSDGRIVLIGRPGVEATLRSASRSPTQHLCFLPNRGALLRVTQDGDIQLFSAVQRRLLTSIWLQGDVINSVALLPSASDPYILLGCESGTVRVVALLDEAGQPAAGGRPAADLSLQPYQVLGQEVDSQGGVVALAVAHLRPDRPLLLLVHRDSGPLVWDIRAEHILCAAFEDGREASKPTCACWVGDRAGCFAVGYDDGSIMVWEVPAAALQGDALKVVEPAEARLLLPLRVAGRGVQASAVRSLSFLRSGSAPSNHGGGSAVGGSGWGGSRAAGAGAGAGWAADDCLLVFGGQGREEPDMLTMLPLAAQQAGEGGGRQVPWFGAIQGFCQMPADCPLAADDRSRGLMILTEGGQLVIHDLLHWQPTPLTLPVQELPPMTLARLVPTVSLAVLKESTAGGSAAVSPRPSSTGLPSPSPRGGEPLSAGSVALHVQQQQQGALPQHALTLDRVRACSRRGGGAGEGGGEGLAPPPLEHWPFTGGQPAASLAGSRRHPSALYFSGHRDGRVRVWDATTQVPELLLTIPAAAGQERLRAVTAMEVDPFSGIVMVGHAGGDVRLYQFSDTPQAVHRMNIDEALIPYENVGLQPAGFQYILRYSTHSSDISSVALATKLKLAAVADESGSLSLLDLLQPAQLFSSRVMQQGVVHAAFGRHVVPGPKDEPGVERVVLFLAGADSSVSMVGLDRGEPIGHGMRPKNASRPLALSLLDASGIPLPLLHGQLVLAWANNNAPGGAPGAGAKGAMAGPGPTGRSASLKESEGRLSRLSLSERASAASPVPPAGSRRSTGADSHRSWSRADSEQEGEREGSVEVHELPSDDDLDSHLAAAVAAAEEEKRQRSKFKLPKAFQRGPNPRQQQGQLGQGEGPEGDLPSPTSSDASAAVAAPAPRGSGALDPGFDPVGALQDFYGPASPGSPSLSASLGSPADPAGLAALRERPGVAGAGVAAAAEGGGGAGEVLSQADLVDYPYLIDGDPTPAAYLLLCCADYLRIYSTDNIRLGDRSTERKASFEAPLVFASPFMSTHGPGVASVDASDALQVHSLPGLELLCRKQLEDSRLLGFRWSCAPAAGSPAGSGSGAGAMCCSLDGQLVLAAPGNEIARLAVVDDSVLPAPPASVYNLRPAQQAAAAAASRRPRGSSAGGGLPRLEVPAGDPPEGETAFSPLGVAAAAGKGFGQLLGQAATTVTGLAASAADSLSHEMQRLGIAGEGGAASARQLPSLQALFATPVEPLEDIDYLPENEDAEAAIAASSGAMAAGAAGAVSASEAASASSSAPASARRLGASLVSPREAAAKLKGLLPGRSKSERAELLDREAAAAAAGGSSSARGAGPAGGAGGAQVGAGGSNYWAAAGKVAPYTRSASEIKSAYGRGGSVGSAGSRAGDVRGIMEQNRAMLAERGERLRALDERSAAMSNDAEDFASLAKKLAEQEANRKWWQL